MTQEQYVSDAVELLKKLIATPSVSRNEKDAADIMEQTIRSYGFEPQREANNLWIIDPHYDESRPTLLLNAHIDTVKPVASWSRDPFSKSRSLPPAKREYPWLSFPFPPHTSQSIRVSSPRRSGSSYWQVAGLSQFFRYCNCTSFRFLPSQRTCSAKGRKGLWRRIPS